jgi:N-acetylmuramoyl-L-alanine amidase
VRDTGIADRLRAAGLAVVEIDGWTTRGSDSFNPRGLVWHHTAGGANGNAPSLEICIYGRSDLPGPLCNVMVGRDNTMFVIAAGTANHAGSGGWRGLSGNSSVYGIEHENVGTQAEPWRPDQIDAAANAAAALIRGRAGADTVCRHAEWTTRKIDTHDIDGNDFRNLVAQYLAGGPPDEPEPPRSHMFCLVQPDDGRGVYRFDGHGMTGVPNPTMLGGDQILLAALGLPNEVFAVSAAWFNSWPVVRA